MNKWPARRQRAKRRWKEWRAQALRLRVEGKTIRQIAEALGYSAGAVHKAISQEIAAIPAEAVADLREVEGARLDADELRLGLIIDAHMEHAQAEIQLGAGEMPGSGADKAADVVVKAVAQRTNIRAQRAKLFGLNAPTRTELTGKDGGALAIDLTSLTDEQLDQLARGDVADLAGTGGAGEAPKSEDFDEG